MIYDTHSQHLVETKTKTHTYAYIHRTYIRNTHLQKIHIYIHRQVM